MTKQRFQVTGMSCASCSAHVEKAVKGVSGVSQVAVSLLTNSMTVEYDETAVNPAAIIKAVEDAGYGASPENGRSEKKREESAKEAADKAAASVKRRLVVSFSFLIPLFYLSMGHMMGWPLPGIFLGHENALTFAFTQFLLCLPIVAVNHKYFTGGYKALWHRAPNMDSLIAIGSSAALVYGIWAIYCIGWGLGHGDMGMVHSYTMDLYFETSGMILALITLGKFLEARSKGKTSEAITKLIALTPKTAFVERDGAETEISAEDVVPGDIVLVKPGARVPVDGVVCEGSSSVDESALTGESIPVEKQPGDRLTGGTINKAGFLKMSAQKVGDDTALSQIIKLVEEAASSKAPIAKLADRVSGVFVPVVIGIALLATIVWLLVGKGPAFAISIGIAVLVVSCPCALGLATPTAIMVGTGKGAENGILIKSGEALETAHLVDTVVLDKTGTVTEGTPKVTGLLPLSGGGDEFLRLAAAMESRSEHPLAEAVVRAAEEKGLSLPEVEAFHSIPGRGIEAAVDGKRFFAGNRQLMEEKGVDLRDTLSKAEELAGEGKTVLFFADEKEVIGLIAAADTIKPTSAAAVKEMKDLGLNVVMLTGDSARTAEAIRKQAGIQTVVAEVLPDGKEKEIRRLQEEGHRVAMVGDGVNDAPALARADVGLAIGAGTDVAIESADIVLMKSDLRDVATAVRLSRAVIRNIRQNLFWALCYNSLGIPLAAGVFYAALHWKLNPMFGAAAMSLSSVCVVTNALRLRFFKTGHEGEKAAEPVKAGSCRIEKMPAEPEKTNTAELPKGEEKMSGNKNRTVVLKIEGMMCGHCTAHVTKALEELGTKAEVTLNPGQAVVEAPESVSDAALKKAVEDAGYKVTAVEDRA